MLGWLLSKTSQWSVVPVTLFLLVLAHSQISHALPHACWQLQASLGLSAVCFCSVGCTALPDDKEDWF